MEHQHQHPKQDKAGQYLLYLLLKKFFLEDPGVSVPSTNLIQDIENTSGFSRVPLSGVNRTADRKTSFNRSTILFIGITGLVLFYLVAK